MKTYESNIHSLASLNEPATSSAVFEAGSATYDSQLFFTNSSRSLRSAGEGYGTSIDGLGRLTRFSGRRLQKFWLFTHHGPRASAQAQSHAICCKLRPP